mmetsp:Transcript_71812/g.126823  ORF Transcript_71812/g.126823 Transcript_71812/m.126823 type:complete len:85 (-) Transcript_71812:1251-1505(-)
MKSSWNEIPCYRDSSIIFQKLQVRGALRLALEALKQGLETSACFRKHSTSYGPCGAPWCSLMNFMITSAASMGEPLSKKSCVAS